MSCPLIYEGQQLSGHEIRLVFLQPSQDRQQRIDCYLRSFELETAPSYEALSYVWGVEDQAARPSILCNGDEIKIGTNLLQALERLRLPYTERVIWADAISINQNDNDEKSHQVPMMGSIYSRAKRVVVWLGDGDPVLIREAINGARYIANACRQSRVTLADWEEYDKIEIPAEILNEKVIMGMRELHDCPYFRRIWCLQEIFLAQDVTVTWGDEETAWEDLGLTVTWIFTKRYSMPHLGGLDAAHMFMMCRSDGYQISLVHALDIYQGWSATDPRDQVYGVLSLVAPESEKKGITVDYNKSPAEVFADTVVSDVRLHADLATLAFVTHPHDYKEEDEVRSWAPRWGAHELLTAPMHWRQYFANDERGSTSAVINVDVEHVSSQYLRLMGIFYDTVSTVYDIMTDETTRSTPQAGEQHPFSAIYKIIAKTASQRDLETLSQGIARTLTCGWITLDLSVQEATPDMRKAYYNAFNIMFHGPMTHSSQPHIDPSVPTSTTRKVLAHLPSLMTQVHTSSRRVEFASPNEQSYDPENTDEGSMIYHEKAFKMCHYRRVFGMQNGSFGLGPQCMRPGDVVVALYGGATSYILRPKGEKWLYLGEAYVDDFVPDEAFEKVEKGQLEAREFFIV